MKTTKLMIARSFNLYRAMEFGHKPQPTQKLIYLRSDHVHRENQFSCRYGNVSHSSTLADGMNGSRFIMNTYSNVEYWDNVFISVSNEREYLMIRKACKDADVTYKQLMDWIDSKPEKGSTLQGPNHVKYDKAGASISYLTKYKWWKPSKTKRICNRQCDDVLLKGFPDAMDVRVICGSEKYELKQADYAGMTPTQSHGMLVNYFARQKP